jgi:hypothetical protein
MWIKNGSRRRPPTQTGQAVLPHPACRFVVADGLAQALVEEEEPRTYLPDVAISEPWDQPGGPALGPTGADIVTAKPIIVDRGEHKLRRLKIADTAGHIIAVIELLSPTNKVRRRAYRPMGAETPREPGGGRELRGA